MLPRKRHRFMSRNNKCLIYANSHHENMRYIHESEKSCASFKRFIQDVDAVLYCDLEDYHSTNFDQVNHASFTVPDALKTRMHKRGQMLVKHQAMLETNFDFNLVLGSDTYAVSNKVNSIFELLEHFDIAVAHAPFRIVRMPDSEPIPVPDSFPEFNCDVIAYRKNARILRFIEQWQTLYREDKFGHPHDQGTFRYLLYDSDLRIATLPPEFNYRGDAYKKDTVIVQNREILNHYLDAQQEVQIKTSLLDKVKLKIKQ